MLHACGAEGAVSRDQGARTTHDRRGRKNRIECPQALSPLEQRQPLLELLAGDAEKGRQQLRAVPPGRSRLLSSSPACSDVDELLDDLEGGGRLERSVGDRLYESAARRAQRMLRSEERRVGKEWRSRWSP